MNQEQIEQHLEMQRREVGGDTESDRNWSRYVDAVAKGLGVVNLDGDQNKDGYSLDFAYTMYEDGLTAPEAVNEFLAIEENNISQAKNVAYQRNQAS